MDDAKRIQQSALWAAYGDALGFMTEFANASLVRSKYGKSLVTEFQPWTRRVGGRFGVSVKLPKGCYSDDTQLRLATARAIAADGTFDVEAFSRVELSVWPAYALGGGRSTKAAALHLATADVNWSTNFYETKAATYMSAGGNGAAMRIQPHVWAARDWDNPQTYVPAVLQNAVCTHGHPRALLGAVFHALTLAASLRLGQVPDPKELEALAFSASAETGKAIDANRELSSIWVGIWERESGKSFQHALRDAHDDLQRDLRKASAVQESFSFDTTYKALATALDAFNEDNRGSAISTTVLAAHLAWLTRAEPNQAAAVSTNALGTDTDTVATMACALIGATVSQEPPEPPMDARYICEQASRLARLHARASNGSSAFTYPDLLQWEPPRTQLDAVESDAAGNYVVAGLGPVKSCGEAFTQPPPQGDAVWQWVELEFGQQLLIKRRQRPRRMKTRKPSVGTGRRGVTKSPSLFDRDRRPAQPESRKLSGAGDGSFLGYEEAIRRATESNFDPTVVGKSLLALTQRSQGIELAMSFAAFVAARAQLPGLRSSSSKPIPRQDAAPPAAQRVAEDFTIVTRTLDDRVYVVIRNGGDAETFKGQIVRLANVEKLPSPLPWTIRWKDQHGDTAQIRQGQEELLELARVQPATKPDAQTGDFELRVFEFFTPRDTVQTKVRVGHVDELTRPVEAVVRITTNNPKRAKSVTVLLSTSLVTPQLSVSVRE